MRMSLKLSVLAGFSLVVLGASAQHPVQRMLELQQSQAQQPRQHRGTMSPYYNVHHRDVPSYHHGGSVTHVESRPGGGHLIYNSGLIISNRPSTTHRPGYCWVPAHYEYVTRRVWHPGHWEEEYIQPVYARRTVNGTEVVILVREGYYEEYWVEGYYEHVRERAWIAGYWRPA